MTRPFITRTRKMNVTKVISNEAFTASITCTVFLNSSDVVGGKLKSGRIYRLCRLGVPNFSSPPFVMLCENVDKVFFLFPCDFFTSCVLF